MKKTAHTIFAYFMSAVLILSTMSFTVHKHFCGAFLANVSLIVPSAGCGMEQALTEDSCELSELPGCCNDKQELLQGQDTLKMDVLAVFQTAVYYAPGITNWFTKPIQTLKNAPAANLANAPPLIQRHLYILHDSFLI
ncbi:MAG: hypothetical protein NWQ09_11270 [Nonlabens sp.]|nr:hypothetical protein [Nonlabens sp.]